MCVLKSVFWSFCWLFHILLVVGNIGLWGFFGGIQADLKILILVSTVPVLVSYYEGFLLSLIFLLALLYVI